MPTPHSTVSLEGCVEEDSEASTGFSGKIKYSAKETRIWTKRANVLHSCHNCLICAGDIYHFSVFIENIQFIIIKAKKKGGGKVK